MSLKKYFWPTAFKKRKLEGRWRTKRIVFASVFLTCFDLCFLWQYFWPKIHSKTQKIIDLRVFRLLLLKIMIKMLRESTFIYIFSILHREWSVFLYVFNLFKSYVYTTKHQYVPFTGSRTYLVIVRSILAEQ